MRRGSRVAVVAAGTVLFSGVGGGSVLTATGGGSSSGDGSPAASESGPSKAREVALSVTGGGRVTGTEAGDEGSHYEIEVALPDGREVDVQLDDSLAVVGSLPADEEGSFPDDEGTSGD